MWYILKSPSLSLSVRDELKAANIEFFLPTHTELRNVGGKQKRVERPIVFNFVFVQSLLPVIMEFCATKPNLRLHLVYGHKPICGDGNAMPLVVSDVEMMMFQKAIRFYNGQEVPFVKPNEMELAKGDYVRIVGGAFSGLEGILVSQKGKEGGRVVVSLSNVIAVRTLEIEPEYLQILKYGKDNKHFYKHQESYIPRLEKLAQRHGEKLTASELAPIKTFVTRFSELQTDTINSEVKIHTMLYASYVILKEDDEARTLRAKIESVLPHVKAVKTLEFAQRYLNLFPLMKEEYE